MLFVMGMNSHLQSQAPPKPPIDGADFGPQVQGQLPTSVEFHQAFSESEMVVSQFTGRVVLWEYR